MPVISWDQVNLDIVFVIRAFFSFTIYSFVGWLIEVVYRSTTQRRLVNAGFLYGPFVPIYGFGAVTVLGLHIVLADLNILLQALIYGLAISGLEYLTGATMERVFGLKLWDYSDNRFNLKGRICLTFSLAWTGIVLLALFIHPSVEHAFSLLDEQQRLWVASLGAAYLFVDGTASIVAIASFRRRVLQLRAEYLSIGGEKVQGILVSFRRLLDAFPRLRVHLREQITDGVKGHVGNLLTVMGDPPLKARKEERAEDAEYLDIVSDIEQNEEFQRLKDYKHHNDTILSHVQVVSYLAYRICKRIDFDFRSAARGGLLHDFFLYDWRNHDAPDLPREKYHGFEHPKIALKNAERNFELNEIERDIIVKHMWPLTLFPPRYKESYIVSFVDKYVASMEFLTGLRKSGKRNNPDENQE